MMFRAFLLALACASTAACAAAQDSHDHDDDAGKADGEDRVDPPSLHGMLLVGETQLFASHLPMFHRPHDFQVITRVELDAEAAAALAANRGQTAYHTLAPKPFVLRRVVDEVDFTFTADLYAGHFERDGELIFRGATVTVKQVVLFKRIHADGVRPEANQYIVFGDGPEKFAAHLINAQPDFDQVLRVTTDMTGLPGVLSIPTLAATDPLVGTGSMDGELGDGSALPFTVDAQIYLEHGDLE